MTDPRARVWTLCLAALVLAALTGPLVTLLAPLAHASSPALTLVAAVLAADRTALPGAHAVPLRLALQLRRADLLYVAEHQRQESGRDGRAPAPRDLAGATLFRRRAHGILLEHALPLTGVRRDDTGGRDGHGLHRLYPRATRHR